jgi:hypothetical protein
MRTALLLTAVLTVFSARASEPTLDPHFAPIAFLVGHCWRADFPDGKQADVQCFESLYGGKLVGNWHVVEGSDPVYEGQTVFSWDDANKRVRYHYFTSTGAVSEGYFVQTAEGATIPERHVSSDGSVIELESSYRPDGKDGYRVVTREKTKDGWVERRNMRYVRTEWRERATR